VNRLLETAPSWHYAGVLLACLLVTLPLELVLGARVYRQPKRLLLTVGLVGLPFALIDWIAIGQGLWWFSERHTLGVELGRFPVEELAFFAVIPVCALLTHGAVRARPWRLLRRRV
jgi:lycopene cyclase domain-containing protein